VGILFGIDGVATCDGVVANADFSALGRQFGSLVSDVLASDGDRGPWSNGGLVAGGALPMGILCDQSRAVRTIVCRRVRTRFMGMYLNYYAFTPEDWEQMQIDDPNHIRKFLEEEHFSLDKCWDVMRFLIGEEAVMGGKESQIEATFGFVRYLLPEEVEAIATKLTKLPFSKLVKKFDAEAFCEAELYPLGRRWNEEEVELEKQALKIRYAEMVNFFKQAANDGDVIVMGLY
jgi:hypothetical protein